MGKKKTQVVAEITCMSAPTIVEGDQTTPDATPTESQLEPSMKTCGNFQISERSEFLKLFWNLAESDVQVRTSAAQKILDHLQQRKEVDFDAFQEARDYTLKRLLRGLASSRDAARQGFSAALTGLLQKFQSIDIEEVRNMLNEAMEIRSSMKGMEQREHMFGKLFGLLAIQRSGRLNDGNNGGEERIVSVIKDLIELSKWKKWIREASYEGILTCLAEITPHAFLAHLVEVFSSILEGEICKYNAEQVALAAGLHHFLQTHKIEDQVPKSFPALHFIRRKHMHLLVEPLKGSTSCYPRIHSAWSGIFGHILHVGGEEKKIDSELFQEAWIVFVENMLIVGTHERKGTGFKLFESVVHHLPRPILRSILTPHFLKCLYNNAINRKNYLHDAAKHCLNVFFKYAPEEYFHFLQSQFCKPLVSIVDEEESLAASDEALMNSKLSVGGFGAILAIEEEREKAEILQKKTSNFRIWALDAICNAVSHLLVYDKESDIVRVDESKVVKLIKQTISFLVFHGFFTIAKDAHGDIKKAKKGKMTTNNDFEIDSNLLHVVPALPSIVHQACAKRVYSLMTHKRQNDAKEETLVMLYDIYKSLTLSSLEEGYVVLRYPLDDSQACIIKKLFSQVEMICAQAQNPATPKTTDNKIQAFWNLFMSCGLQLLDSIQRSEATTAVEDLLRCYPEICSKSNSSNEESLVVLTDMLLSILSQPSSALREIVSQVFRAVLPMLNVPALETIVQALKDEEEYEHKHHDSEADEIDEDDKEEEEEEEEEEIVLTTAAQVSEALRNDEHLAELHREDTTLSAIVGKVNDKRKKKQDAKRLRTQLMHFKLRVLDLLQVYVTKCSSQAQVLELILPLFEQLTTTKATSESKVLSERLHAVLNNKLVRAKEVPSSIKAKERAIDILGQVLELLINKPMEKEHVIVGVNVVLYLMRLFANSASDKKTLDNLKTLFDTLVKDSFTKKHSRIPRQIFDDLITRFPQIAFLLLSESLGGVCAEGVAVDDFSRCEAFRMLAALFKLKNLQDAQESCFKKVHESLLLYTLAALNADMKAKRLRTLITFVQSFIKCSLSIKMTGGLENIVSKLEELHFSSPVIKNMVDRILKSLQEVNITKQMTGKKRSMEIEDKNTSEEATATFQTPSKKQKNQSIKVLEKVKETKSRSTIKSSQSH